MSRPEFASNRYFVRQAMAICSVLAALIYLIWVLYSPGLSGGLVFDDIPNLQAIQSLGGVSQLESLIAFLLSSDFLPGRPLSLLSFALDDQHWPLNEARLKATNLKLHMVNAMLCLWLTWLLLSIKSVNSKVEPVSNRLIYAGLVALLWSCHPFQVSTVSYIIQRMTELSALFSFVAMIAFVKFRTSLPEKFGANLAKMTVVLGLALPLGILSKENALLICLYILIIDRLFFSSSQLEARHMKIWFWWKLFFLYLPILAFIGYWIFVSEFFAKGFEFREFTLEQRLLTQARVIWLYLGGIIFPRIGTMGLFNDSLQLSINIFDPFTTVISIVSLGCFLGLAIYLKDRAFWVCFGVLFFFTGHLMESTFLPLELYFEHRNYLPQYGLWLAVILSLNQLIKKVPKLRAFIAVGLFSYIFLCCFITIQLAKIWGNNYTLAEQWHRTDPESVRATQFLAGQLLKLGQTEKALEIIVAASDSNPNSAALSLGRGIIGCADGKFGLNIDAIERKLKMSSFETGAYESLKLILRSKLYEKCEGLSLNDVERFFVALADNEHIRSMPKPLSRIYESISDIALIKRNFNDTLSYLDMACELDCTPLLRLKQVEILLLGGLVSEAEKKLSHAEELMDRRLNKYKYPELANRIMQYQAMLKNKSI